MKIKVGDRVKFLNDTGEGTVSRIADQKTALVQIDGGFEIPCLIKDLVVDAGRYSSDLDDEEEEVPESIPEPKSFSEQIEEKEEAELIDDEEVLLAFLPDSNSSVFNTYLINSSSYQLKYTIARQQDGEMVLFQEGTLEAGIKVQLGKYQPGNLNDEESFRIQAVFYNIGFYRHLPPLDMLINVKASEMYEAEMRVENDYFLEKAILFSLHDWRKPKEKPGIEIDAELLKRAMLTKGDIKPEKKVLVEPKINEVDLHIEQLSDNFKHLDNGEILEIQLAKFKTSLESALIHKSKRIVFIHGVGNGKLKYEIRKILDTEYASSVRYQDASFKEYGFGATMVLIK